MDTFQEPKEKFEIKKHEHFSSTYCTESAGLEYLKERYPDARITGQYRGSGYCYYVNGSLAMKPAKMSHLGYKLCNEFCDTYIKES